MEFAPIEQRPDDPPFEQLRRQIASRVSTGELAAGTRLPTVRDLAAQLGLAVNTVARTYKELEADGVVLTQGRRGTFVRPGAASESGDANQAAEEYAATARRLGLSLADAQRLVERSWRDR